VISWAPTTIQMEGEVATDHEPAKGKDKVINAIVCPCI